MCQVAQLAVELSSKCGAGKCGDTGPNGGSRRGVDVSRDTIKKAFTKNLYGGTETSLKTSQRWKQNINYFKTAHISSLALLKMSMHARSGGSIEVMGMMTGKIVDGAIVVIDAYALPVEGTETRVNAQAEGYEYMVQYLESSKRLGSEEDIVGWYHSHPGYGCWLSGIDVATQASNQSFQDPYLAVVIDPEKTISKGVVEIGAFRTYPEGVEVEKQQSSKSSEKRSLSAQHIPKSKIKDFGAHSSRYYSLNVEIFKSEMDSGLLDIMWNNYWTSTFSQVSSESDIQNFYERNSYGIEQINSLSERLRNEEPSKLGRLDKKALDIYNSMNSNSNKKAVSGQDTILQRGVTDEYYDSDDDVQTERQFAPIGGEGDTSGSSDEEEDDEEDDEDQAIRDDMAITITRGARQPGMISRTATSESLGLATNRNRNTAQTRVAKRNIGHSNKTGSSEPEAFASDRILDRISNEARLLGNEEIRNLLILKTQKRLFLGDIGLEK